MTNHVTKILPAVCAFLDRRLTIGDVSFEYRSALYVAIALMIVVALVACGPKTPEQKVQDQMGKVHALSAEERGRAQTNAKAFYEKQWITAGNERGQFNECRPSDSNANGLVTCVGFVPVAGGGFKEMKRYCGYTPQLVGCSDEDVVK